MECFNGSVACITVVFIMIILMILIQYERNIEEKGLDDGELYSICLNFVVKVILFNGWVRVSLHVCLASACLACHA